MRAFALILLSFTNSERGAAQNYIGECGKNLKYDTAKVQNNLAYRLAIMRTINEGNFEEKKQNGAANVVIEGLPAGASWNDYRKSTSEFSSILNSNASLNIEENLQFRAVSDAGWSAYQQCIVSLSRRPLVAFISGISPVGVSVTLRTYLVSGLRARIETGIVSGGSDQKIDLIDVEGSADRNINITSDGRHDLLVSFNLVRGDGIAIDSATIRLPHEINLRPRIVDKVILKHNICKAGDQHSTRGNLFEPEDTFVPDPDFVLLDDYKFSVTSNPAGSCTPLNQIRDFHNSWEPQYYGWSKVDERSVRVKPLCEASSTHTQSCATYDVSVTERSIKYEEISNLQPNASP